MVEQNLGRFSIEKLTGMTIGIDRHSEFFRAVTAEQYCDALFEKAKIVLVRDKHHTPMLFLFFKDHMDVIMVAPLMETDQKKDVLSGFARGLAKEKKPLAIGFISEIWMKKVIPMEQWDGVRPSDSPDRIEGLMVNIDNADKTRHGRMWQFKKDKEGNITGGLEVDPQKSEITTGRFARFFEDEKDVNIEAFVVLGIRNGECKLYQVWAKDKEVAKEMVRKEVGDGEDCEVNNNVKRFVDFPKQMFEMAKRHGRVKVLT